MKKILLTTIICALLGCTSMPAIAGKCEGGTEFQGTVNGHTYCRGHNTITWWAAVMWCKKQGRELATLDQACANWSNTSGESSCPNMKLGGGQGGHWLMSPHSSHESYVLNLNAGSVAAHARNNHFFTLCY